MKRCHQCDEYKDYEKDGELKHKCILKGKDVEPWHCACHEKYGKENT